MKVCLRVLALLCAVVLSIGCLSACSNEPEVTDIDSSVIENPSNEVSSEVVSKEPVKFMNNLTGCYDIEDESVTNKRPVAVMVNNLASAQKVQTGLSKASIVYESLAEGGISRLLAIYKDISEIKNIGSIRSARYSFVDLACGHDALYFHCGADPDFCDPYMDQLGIDDIDINLGKYERYGFRHKNGLAWEHTMYTSGEMITKAMTDKGHRTEKSDKKAAFYKPWQNFAKEDEQITLPDGVANNVSVYFSASYVTSFKYDSETQKYVKSNKSGNNTDYKTGERLSYKNVFVLFDNVKYFPGNYRVYSDLDSGSGYYVTNGTVMSIKWTKGTANQSFKFTDANGNAIKLNAGNSYVCIAPKDKSSKTTIV